MERLFAPGNKLKVKYSSLYGYEWNEGPEQVVAALQAIEQTMNVQLPLRHADDRAAASTRSCSWTRAPSPANVINSYKFYLWQRWGLDCGKHEGNWEFSFFLNAGEPLYAALQAITQDMPPGVTRYLIAHEWLGLPVIFSALLRDDCCYRTIFYAHEVATARLLVEEQRRARHPLLQRAAPGPAAGREPRPGLRRPLVVLQTRDAPARRRVRPHLRGGRSDRGRAAVPRRRLLRPRRSTWSTTASRAAPIDLEQKLASRELLLQYAENLYGFRPDYIFTHVTRMVPSKALWRDVRVLEHLEWKLAAQGKSAVVFIVSTAAPTGRRAEDVFRWEAEYGWPVNHRGRQRRPARRREALLLQRAGAVPLGPARDQDLPGQPVRLGAGAAAATGCPRQMRFADLRAGSDLEFGQSIYEPFGIAQVEPLSAGALCVPSSVCGCVGFVSRADGGEHAADNLIVGDYVYIPPDWKMWSPWDALRIDRPVRDGIEARQSWEVAQQIADRLPKNERGPPAAARRGPAGGAGHELGRGGGGLFPAGADASGDRSPPPGGQTGA